MKQTVETTGGLVRGITTSRGATAFLGIPYAAPPVGPLRFRRPGPLTPWAGILDTDTFGASPVQSTSSLYSGVIPGNQVERVDEDCLTVSVWTPGPAPDGTLRPVMVWICGGAYLTGGTAIETYDGARLAAEGGVVVVSVNYRLGALGFLHVDDGDTNCGLRDQLAALAWVGDNAAAFGGDPGRVTVFGESAGAGSVLHILATAAREGVLQRAILQSPGVEHTQDLSHAERVASILGATAGATTSAQLRELTWEEVLAAQEKALPALMGDIGAMPFHPVVDGDIVASAPGTGLGIDAGGVDLMVGWTAEEMRLYPDPRVGEEGRLEQYVRGMVARRRGEDPGSAEAARVIDFYSGAGSPADVRSAIQTDALMRLPARRVALDHAARSAGGASTFAVQFDWGATGGEWRRGAFHAVDLPFTFGTLDRAGWLEFLGASPDDRGALELEARHIEAWSRFAHDGDPGWGRYPSTLMRLDGEGRGGPVPDPLGPAAELWAGLWPASGHPV